MGELRGAAPGSSLCSGCRAPALVKHDLQKKIYKRKKKSPGPQYLGQKGPTRLPSCLQGMRARQGEQAEKEVGCTGCTSLAQGSRGQRHKGALREELGGG